MQHKLKRFYKTELVYYGGYEYRDIRIWKRTGCESGINGAWFITNPKLGNFPYIRDAIQVIDEYLSNKEINNEN